jgi:two-component system chemotaxis response regulator CheY
MSNLLTSILIVDDSATTRSMIKRVIEMTELPVKELLEAENGLLALELLRSRHVDLVLADLSMPVMGGAEMIRQMRSEESLRGIPVVVISAQPDDEQIFHLREYGVAGYLAKPFTPESVRDLVGPLLDGHCDVRKSAPVAHSGMYMSLAEAFGDALQTMAFITPDLSDEHQLSGNDLQLVRVDFHGQGVKGALTIAAPSLFGAVVASNCGNDAATSASEDALKELANVTCGLLLRSREGGARGIELAPPTIQRSDGLEALFAAGDSVVLVAEGFQVAAHIESDLPLFKPEEDLV